MVFKTTEEAQQYVKNAFGISKVSFDGIFDIAVVENLVLAFEEIFPKYPGLSSAIWIIGPKEYIRNDILELLRLENQCSEYIEEVLNIMAGDDFDDDYMNIIFDSSTYYIGFGLPYILLNMKFRVIDSTIRNEAVEGKFTKHANFKSLVFHEIGHILYYILDLENDLELKAIIANRDIEKEVSKTATESLEELIAEAFAEYHISKEASPFIKQIGRFIDMRYTEFLKKKLLDTKVSSKVF